MESESSRYAHFRERREAETSVSSKRLLGTIAVSAALHAGVTFHRELADKVEQSRELVTKRVTAIERDLRLAIHKTEAAQAQEALIFEYAQRLEGEQPLEFDLSDFYFTAEVLEAGLSPAHVREAMDRYDSILAHAKVLQARDGSFHEVMGYVLKQQGEHLTGHPLMADLLVGGEGNCEARAKFIASMFEDLYPDRMETHDLLFEIYGPYVDEAGEKHAGHIRAVAKQDEGNLQILEGDAVLEVPLSESTAPKYEAHWLAAASYLAKHGAYEYPPVPGSNRALSNELGGSDLAFAMPPSASHYEMSRGTQNVAPEPVRGSWAFSQFDLLPENAVYRLTDEELKARSEERLTAKVERRDALLHKYRSQGIKFIPRSDYLLNPIPEEVEQSSHIFDIDLRGHKGSMLTTQELHDLVGQINALGAVDTLRLRGDQELPEGLASFTDDVEYDVGSVPTPESLRSLPSDPFFLYMNGSQQAIDNLKQAHLNLAGTNLFLGYTLDQQQVANSQPDLRGLTVRTLGFSGGSDGYGALPKRIEARYLPTFADEIYAGLEISPAIPIDLTDAPPSLSRIQIRGGEIDLRVSGPAASIGWLSLDEVQLKKEALAGVNIRLLSLDSPDVVQKFAFKDAVVEGLYITLRGRDYVFAPGAFLESKIKTVHITGRLIEQDSTAYNVLVGRLADQIRREAPGTQLNVAYIK